MNLQSLYNNISERTPQPLAEELPPINNTDVNQYTNILAKKSYLNKDAPILKENTNVPAAQKMQTQMPASQPRSLDNITGIFSAIQKRYNSATNQEKQIISKVLNSLT